MNHDTDEHVASFIINLHGNSICCSSASDKPSISSAENIEAAAAGSIVWPVIDETLQILRYC